ncbi:MAG: enoyl-CoA hydratase [Chloroflexi bacterium]|nr:enoyl-CoA hydratase [Chloroflexota bacterium]|tara:strand:+ start:3560 stop:3982 length:423 start_codon:yes stop_codon:yes gene_type:complete
MTEPVEAKLDNLHIGQKAEFTETITESMIQEFAKLSGDYNPHHIDEEYAKKTKYEKRICHGMLLASLFSKLTAMYLPGQGSLYISQTLNFVSPAFIDDIVTASGEITKISSSTGIIRVKTEITNMNNNLLVSGEAKVLIP